MLANQAAAFRAGISGKDMPGWCPPGSLLAKTYRKGKKYFLSIPFPIEDGEWYFKGCFIQLSKHPSLIGSYEVFKDDAGKSPVGRFQSFKHAVKACKKNHNQSPLLGILKLIG
jgi:hypothetical protein